MNPIRKLTSLEIQKIAAGEVIERPYSIVKELVENAIDAKSTFISVSLTGQDIHTLEVIDNGIGMDRESALLSIELHTSSKCINSDLDLSSLPTYGFRGEALAAIFSCSDFTLTTKTESSILGTKITKIDNNDVKIEEVSCNKGTQIEVSNVFKYTPVRKKFLKSDQTEYNHVYDTLMSYVLSGPNIHFRLKKNDYIVFDYIGVKDYKERIEQILELYKKTSLVFVNNETSKYKIYGCCSDYSYKSYNRSDIIFFVNKRRVKQYKLTQAFLKGYQGALDPNKYPYGTIFLEIDTNEVDVNVHPRKEEVAFLHPRKVELFIEESIKKNLESHIKNQILPINLIDKPDQFKKETFTIHSVTKKINPSIEPSYFEDFDTKSTIIPILNVEKERHTATSDIQQTNFLNTIFNQTPIVKESIEIKTEIKEPTERTYPIQTEINQTKILFEQNDLLKELNYHFLGVLHRTYLLIEKKEGLLLVDQHALHERIIYEELCKSHNQFIFQPLLLPISIYIQLKNEYLELYENMLYRIGIKTSFIKKNEIIITETSSYLKHYSLQDLVENIVEEINFHQDIYEIEAKIINTLYADVACKKAIKGGDVLPKVLLEELLKYIYNVDSISVCPHGRPTSTLIKTYEIEKKFKRHI